MYYRLKGEMPARAVVARIAAVIVIGFFAEYLQCKSPCCSLAGTEIHSHV